LTIFVNSLSQLAFDLLVKIRMGYTDEQILAKDMTIIAGGDDTLQTFPDNFDLDKYVKIAGELGFKLDFKVHDSFEGCEFFSTVFTTTSAGILQYKPVRFTKHIEKLKRVKSDDIAPALASAMINYCWDEPKFNFFHKMYRTLRQSSPAKFPLSLLKNYQYLRYVSKGFESASEPVRADALDTVLDELVTLDWA